MPGWYMWNNWQYLGFNCHQQARNEIKHKFDTYWYVKKLSKDIIVHTYIHIELKTWYDLISALGIADIISILTMFLNWTGPTLFDKIGYPIYYPITLPLDWLGYNLGTLLTVLLTLERYYSVCILKAKPNLKHTKVAIFCVFIISLIGNFHQVFSAKWKTEGMNYCSKQNWPSLI